MDDNEDSLQQKVHAVEHKIYPLAVEWICSDKLKWTPKGILIDNQPLPSEGYQLDSSV